MIRNSIKELMQLGVFPASRNAIPAVIRKQEELLRSIVPPLSDEEAREMVKLFGPDDYFGCAWTVLHLVEAARHWPLADCLSNGANEWVARLRQRISRTDA